MILVFSEDSGGKYSQKNLSNKKNLLFFDKFPVTASSRGAAGEPVAVVAARLPESWERRADVGGGAAGESGAESGCCGGALCSAGRQGQPENSGGRCGRAAGEPGAVVAAGLSVPQGGGPAGAPGWMLRRSFSGGCSVRRRPVFAVFAVSPDADARKAPRHAAEPAFLPIFAHIWQ